MDPIQHSPYTKVAIKEALYSHLYDPVNKGFIDRITALRFRNAIEGKTGIQCFTYRGHYYGPVDMLLQHRRNKLIPSLVPEMQEYLAELKHLNEKEIPYVMGYINKVLNSTNILHDYLKLLPETLHTPIKAVIAACPCRTHGLTEEDAKEFVEANKEAILLMKQRMVINLII